MYPFNLGFLDPPCYQPSVRGIEEIAFSPLAIQTVKGRVWRAGVEVEVKLLIKQGVDFLRGLPVAGEA